MTTPPAITGSVESPTKPMLHDPQNWGPILDLPCELTLDLPVPRFSVRDLLRLQPGTVVETAWPSADDVPLHINGQLIVWTEFEVFADRLAVRLTEWA